MSGQVLEFHRAGKLRILAVCSPTRLAGTPELATAVEQGFPNLIALGLTGLLARLEPDLDSTPEKFRRSLEDDVAHWTPIVNAIGLKID
jgi:tripartite-type tricarboxylate transporter receptor subunit TctC